MFVHDWNNFYTKRFVQFFERASGAAFFHVMNNKQHVHLRQVRAEQGCPAGSSRGTSAGRGSAGHGRWGGCAAARRCGPLTRCSPWSPPPLPHWGAEAGGDMHQLLNQEIITSIIAWTHSTGEKLTNYFKYVLWLNRTNTKGRLLNFFKTNSAIHSRAATH